jgi:imidazolonepropionase-like amidohydrolase
MRRLAIVGLLLACATGDSLPGRADARSSVLAILDATVIHPERSPAAAVAPDTTIIIAGNRIRAVGPSGTTPVPDGARIIEGAGTWVIPGLIDAHVHFFQSGNLYTRPDVADFRGWMPYERETARNRARLPATFKVWLASGVTGLVDVGGPMWNFEVRDLARRTREAPRVAAAGPLVSTVARPELDLGDPPIVRVGTPGEARALVQAQLRARPDYVKVWFIHRPGDSLAGQTELVKTAAETAHAAGVRLAVHATELEVAKAAVRAGADFLVHSVDDALVDGEFLELARRRDIIYCPTLFVPGGYGLALSNTWEPTEAERRLADPEVLSTMRDLDVIPAGTIPARVAALMREPSGLRTRPVALRNVRRVWDAGISVVMGTDAGNIGTLHGPSVFRETALMAQAGLTALEVLRAATTNGARALGMAGDLGVIAPGRLADLVILERDPLADIGNLSRIRRVVKDGEPFDPGELIRSIR